MPNAERASAGGLTPDNGVVGFAVRTLGCKVNQVESEQIAANLLAGGFRLVPDDEAEVVVVNTCTVTGEADAKARKLVRAELRRERAPIVVVTGCLASVDAASLERLGGRVVVVADKSRVAEQVARACGGELGDEPAANRSGRGFHTRAMVKIQDGCDNRCAYCIVPTARGLPRSVSHTDVVREVSGLLESGVREIVLTGINLGRYESHGFDLTALVRELDALGVPRLRLSSIEPPDVTDRLLDALGESRSVCAHLHVPLQSGSDRVLEAMGRRYDLAGYARRIEAARDSIPGLAVTTDVIAGFPGEREQDAEATRLACERIGFSRLHVFRYSERASTPAATLPDAVPGPERARRAAALRAVDETLRARYARSRAGGDAVVLVERVDSDGDGRPPVALGTTGDYLKVRMPGEGVGVGDLVSVRLGVPSPDGTVSGIPSAPRSRQAQ